MSNLESYELREKIMYAATNALNNLTAYGRKNGDWAVHSIGHTLSVLYDVPHGASLSIGYPAWMRLHKDRAGDRIVELGKNLFNTSSVDETIAELEKLFVSLSSPVRLSDIGIDALEKGEEIINTMISNNVSGNHYKLEEEHYRELVKQMA
jgi:alcohol dehydrogenase YqhD (iron-dependent ADH family)